MAIIDGVARDLSSITKDIDGAFLASGGIDHVRDAYLDLPPMDIRGLRIGAPVARPHAVWCIGMNYEAHAAESGVQPPAAPVLFLKPPNTIVGPTDDIHLPRGSMRTDWEVELAVVIGTRTTYLERPEDAWGHIAGYTISNDVSEREFQLEHSGGQWSKGKCCATFNPLGPSMLTADQLDPSALRLRSWVNGSLRQDSTTADLIFDVPTIVHHLSQYAVLEPGDIINTGTPQGVALSGRFPYLKSGDVVDVEIEGIGRMTNRVSDSVHQPY